MSRSTTNIPSVVSFAPPQARSAQLELFGIITRGGFEVVGFVGAGVGETDLDGAILAEGPDP